MCRYICRQHAPPREIGSETLAAVPLLNPHTASRVDSQMIFVALVNHLSNLKQRIQIATLCSICLSGCAIGNFGTLGARVQDFSGGQVIELHIVGLHLRTRLHDAGIGLGYAKRRYAFANSSLKPGWYLFYVPVPDREPFAIDGRSFGMEFSTLGSASGLTIGYEHSGLRGRISADSSVYLEYDGSASKIIRYVQCGENPCDLN